MPEGKKIVPKSNPASKVKKEEASPKEETPSGGPKAPASKVNRTTQKKLKTASGEKSAEKSTEKSERSSREPREPRGGGGGKVKFKLSIKFAICIIVILTMMLLVMGIIVGSNTQSILIDQIEKRGYAALKVCIASGEEYVLQFAIGIKDYNDTISSVVSELKSIKERQDKGEKLSEEDRARFEQLSAKQSEIRSVWETKKNDLMNRFNKRFEKAVADDNGKDHGALFNVIVNIEGYGGIQAKKAFDIGGQKYEYSQDASVEITKGTLTTESGKIPAWSFIKYFTMPNPKGGADLKGQAITVLSSEKIDEVKSQNNMSIATVILAGLVVGIGVAFFFSAFITKPISQLVSDIEMVAKGNLEHRTLVRSNDEIGLLAHTFDVMTRNLNMAHKSEVENRAREHELGIAQEIQANLLPKKIPQIAGYDLGCFYLPSKEVGGDYYDYIQIDENHLGLIVADVSGKGVPGSMVMTMARSLIRYEAQNNLDPVDTFIKVNRILAQDIRRGMFVTAMYLILDTRTGKMKVASAGHNPMVVFRDKTKKVEEINPNGIALGFDKGPIFERTIKAEELQLFKGDRLALYTDGVVEAMSPDNEEFGEEKFYQLCELHSHLTSSQYINLIVKELDKHRADAQQSDDITISTLKLLK